MARVRSGGFDDVSALIISCAETGLVTASALRQNDGPSEQQIKLLSDVEAVYGRANGPSGKHRSGLCVTVKSSRGFQHPVFDKATFVFLSQRNA